MHNGRLKNFKLANESHLRFYIIYLSHQGNKNCCLQDLALLDYKGLQHRFIETLATHLIINVDSLEKEELTPRQNHKLNRELDHLHDNLDVFLINDEYTSWLKSDREILFFHSMLKIIFISKKDILARPNDIILIGESLWPKLNNKKYKNQKNEHEKKSDYQIQKFTDWRKTNSNTGGFSRLINRSKNTLIQKECIKDKDISREVKNSSSNQTLEAIKIACTLCSTIDKKAHITIINHLTHSCIVKDIELETAQELLIALRSLYIKSYQKISLDWDILKTENNKLISKTYDRLDSQYKITNIFFPTRDPIIQKQCIITTLDLLFATTNNFEHRLKLLADKFSLDKSNSEDHSIFLNDKQWDMLVDIAGGNTKTKINLALNKILKEAYKNRFNGK